MLEMHLKEITSIAFEGEDNDESWGNTNIFRDKYENKLDIYSMIALSYSENIWYNKMLQKNLKKVLTLEKENVNIYELLRWEPLRSSWKGILNEICF